MDACPICERVLDPLTTDSHHLIPKTFNGKEVVNIHRICHRTIHATFSERELLKHYHTVDRIRAHPTMLSFIEWVQSKSPEYYTGCKESRSRRSHRK